MRSMGLHYMASTNKRVIDLRKPLCSPSYHNLSYMQIERVEYLRCRYETSTEVSACQESVET